MASPSTLLDTYFDALADSALRRGLDVHALPALPHRVSAARQKPGVPADRQNRRGTGNSLESCQGLFEGNRTIADSVIQTIDENHARRDNLSRTCSLDS